MRGISFSWPQWSEGCHYHHSWAEYGGQCRKIRRQGSVAAQGRWERGSTHVTEENPEKPSQHNRSVGHIWNQTPPEYEAGVPTFHSRLSVAKMFNRCYVCSPVIVLTAISLSICRHRKNVHVSFESDSVVQNLRFLQRLNIAPYSPLKAYILFGGKFYDSIFRVEDVPSKHQLSFDGLHWVISQKI